MTTPTLKPNHKLIAKFKAELLRQKAETEALIQPIKEILKQPELKPKAKPAQERIEQPQPESKIHARVASPIQQIASAAMMPRPAPQSTVSSYQSDGYLITEKKTFA